MKRLFVLVTLLLTAAGCSKQEPAATQPESAEPASTSTAAPTSPAVVTPRTTAPRTAPAPTAPAPARQPVSGVKPLEGRVDPQMTALLKKFIQEKGRLPDSILELAGAMSDGFPLAPAGYLYAIDPATSEVKLIKQ